MKTEEAIEQAKKEIASVIEIQAQNIAWCLMSDLRPELTRRAIAERIEPLQLALEDILR